MMEKDPNEVVVNAVKECFLKQIKGCNDEKTKSFFRQLPSF